MAEAAAREELPPRQPKCTVCSTLYNTTDRLPICLQCRHIVCKKCMRSLTKGNTIKCPKCDQHTPRSRLSRDGSSCTIEMICLACECRSKEKECQHCDSVICAKCYEDHCRALHGEVLSKLDLLRKEIDRASILAKDTSVIDNETNKSNQTIAEIEAAISIRKSAMERLHLQLINEVIENPSVGVDVDWKAEIDRRLNEMAPDLDEIRESIQGIRLRDCIARYGPGTNNEPFGPVPDEEDSQQAADTTESVLEANISVRYQNAQSEALVRSEGSSPEQFGREGYVTCVENRYVLSDTCNHRLKIFDKDLNLMFVVGELGENNYNLNEPRGICTSPKDEVFLSDSLNHRIKVYSKHLELLRTFGSRGAGDDGFDLPMGLAVTFTGELLVCDARNYRVKIHKPDGNYVGSIGSKGSGTGRFEDHPVCVAATLDRQVIVAERNASCLQMFNIKGDYVWTLTPNIPILRAPVQIWGFAVDKGGNIILTGGRDHTLIVVDPAGEFVCTVGQQAEARADGPEDLCEPTSLAMSNNNRKIIIFEGAKSRIRTFEM